MKVSVLVLVYNDPVLVERAIKSVTTQTYKDLEILLLDNGSTDRTPEVLRQFVGDPRVRIVTNAKNQKSEFPTAQARLVTTEALCFLFSDDYYEPNRIETMVLALKDNPGAAAVFANNTYVDENERALINTGPALTAIDVSSMDAFQHLRHFMFKGNSLHPCGMLIRTRDYVELGGFAPFLHRIGDMTFFARLLSHRPTLFLKQKLQNITVMSNNRNESFANAMNKQAVAFERICFLGEYRHEAMLTILDKVFPEIVTEQIQSLPGRLFQLGLLILAIPTQDHRLFGMRCLYDAYLESPAQIDKLCQEKFGGLSFSQYCDRSQAQQSSSLAKRVFHLRQMVNSLPGGPKLIGWLRPLVQSVRPN